MLVTIPDLVTPEDARTWCTALLTAEWSDGRATAGHVALRVKQNLQLAESEPVAARYGKLLLDALARNPLFIAAALPLRILPPRFNRYEAGGHYGTHVDSSILGIPGSGQRVRTDLSATVFLSDPGEYDGGELVIEGAFGSRSIKLPAGHMVLYAGASLHRVTPVTRGVRLASFFWIQSLVRDPMQRSLLFDLDGAIQALGQEAPDSHQIARLTGIYHNLLRQWSET
jgi:PKHD-type hydroxylase